MRDGEIILDEVKGGAADGERKIVLRIPVKGDGMATGALPPAMARELAIKLLQAADWCEGGERPAGAEAST